MKRNLLIALSMLCVLTAIAGGTRMFKNKTAKVAANNVIATNYENLCMALDCLDSQMFVAMEESEDFACGTIANEISNLRNQVETANANGNLNSDEVYAAIEMIQSQIN